MINPHVWKSLPLSRVLHGILFFCLMAMPGAWASDPPRLTEAQTSHAAIVWGIVSHTRWPVQPSPLRVCFIGQTTQAEAIQRSSDWIEPEHNSVMLKLDTPNEAASRCDLLYFGTQALPATERILRQIAGKPVLSIEGQDFCSAGGMFCLEKADGNTRFSVNLDAVSRSPLRINPQVFRLSRQLREIGS